MHAFVKTSKIVAVSEIIYINDLLYGTYIENLLSILKMSGAPMINSTIAFVNISFVGQ